MSGHEEGSERARLESRDDGKLTRATSPEVQAVSATFHDWADAADRTCICGSRAPIQRSLSDASIERVATIAKPIRIGDPLDPEPGTGPLALEGWLEQGKSCLEPGRPVVEGTVRHRSGTSMI